MRSCRGVQARRRCRGPEPARRGGFVLLLVLWVVGLATLVLLGVQTASMAEAVGGREVLARVRAYWAARAGLEATIAALEEQTERPVAGDAFAALDAMSLSAEGSLPGAIYRVSRSGARGEILGPADAHARINVNGMSRATLMLLPMMTEDVADSILDWIDTDEDTRPLGAEAGYYLSQPGAVVPRNGPIRNLQELELIAGVLPEYVRGEDWNLNGRLDPNENDGGVSWPPDNADNVLDAGWSGIVTASSVQGGVGPSGQPRLNLAEASAGDVANRLGVSGVQAEAIVEYAQAAPSPSLSDYLRQNLAQLLRAVESQTQLPRGEGTLGEEALAALYNECYLGTRTAPGAPGRLNINTCEAETLEHLAQVDPSTADAILLERSSRPAGFVSIIDLLAVPSLPRQRLAGLADLLDVRSSAWEVTSRGRDVRTGVEVELVAVLDAAGLPVVIREIRIR